MSEKKILIVDDSSTSIAQSISLFNRTRCAVSTASNGREALEKIRDERPDLVLMDLHMPEMNGDECCRVLKSYPSFREIPVIIYSTSREEEERKRCLAAGCDEYLTRQAIDDDALLKAVRKFIDIPIRNHIRVSIDTKLRIFRNGREYPGILHNISSSGGFLETKEPLQIGSIINLSFTIPNSSNQVEVAGEVIRVIQKAPETHTTRIIPGVGIRFVSSTWKGKMIIEDYVKARERKRMTVA